MEAICEAFYAQLYAQHNTPETAKVAQAEILQTCQIHLNPEMQERLRAPITLNELTAAINALTANNSPGPDGMATKFLRALWPVIGSQYYRMILDSIARGSLPTGVTEGLIMLLHKEGDRETLNNWRRITLLNATYKILAMALQIRLQPILVEVIHPDQPAFLLMRYILDNIFLTHETIHFPRLMIGST
jgi:hypothetical protein